MSEAWQNPSTADVISRRLCPGSTAYYPRVAIEPQVIPSGEFADIVQANEAFVARFRDSGLTGRAQRGLAVVTCIDSRIDPLAALGLAAGDAKIVRNAGARVTDEVLRTLVLASHLLGVTRVLVMPHTDCRMATGDERLIHEAIYEASGIDTRSVEMRTVSDQREALRTDLVRVRTYPLLAPGLTVGGAIFDVRSGHLDLLEEELLDQQHQADAASDLSRSCHKNAHVSQRCSEGGPGSRRWKQRP